MKIPKKLVNFLRICAIIRPRWTRAFFTTVKGGKFMRAAKFLVPLVIIAVAVFWSGSLSAFHDSGVAHCNGCHTMHNSQDGVLVDSNSPNGNPRYYVSVPMAGISIPVSGSMAVGGR